MKVSLIIPVFNAEDYIEETLQSVLDQSYNDLEIVLIDDGSGPACAELLENLTSRDEKIILYTQENSGVSSARNKGIELATGEIIGFVDADDLLEKEMVERMVKEFSVDEIDWVICSVDSIDKTKKRCSRRSFSKEIICPSNKENFQIRLMRGEFDNANWNKLYKAEVIKKNDLRFTEALFLWEDLAFNIIFSNYSRGISLVERPLYIHRIHQDSLYRSNALKRWPQFCRFFDYLEQEYGTRNKKIPEWLKNEISRAAIYTELPFMVSFQVRSKGYYYWAKHVKNILKDCDSNLFFNNLKGMSFSAKLQLLLLNKKIYDPLLLWWWKTKDAKA